MLDGLAAALEGKTYEVIVVDDASTDSTAEIVLARKSVKLVQHPQNMGYGAALKSGIRQARYNLILIIDSDGSYAPQEIPGLLEHAGQYDMVIGARTGDKVNIQLYRRPAKWFLSQLANYLIGIKIPDLNSGMRIFKKDVIEKFFNILPNAFSFTTTSTLAFHANGHSVKYIPINYHQRIGRSKISPLRDGFNFIMLILRTITYFNPLKVFLSIGLVLLLAAIFVALYSLLVIGKFMDVTTILLVITAIQAMFFGLLADLVVRRHNKSD